MLDTLCNFNEKEMKPMKAVILETRKNKAVALSDDGRVKEILNKNYKIGQTIEMERNTMKKMSKKYRNIAGGIAASLVILLGGGTAYAYNTPVAHVSLDVNPSITYSINSFNKVISEESNLDAVDILQTIEWNGKNINQVLEDTILALKEKNYLKNGTWYEDSIIIGVNATSAKNEEKLILAIKNKLATMVAEETGKEIDTDLDLEDVVTAIGAKRVEAAAQLSKDLGYKVTPGKLNLVQKLYASDPELAGTTVTSDAAIWFEGSVKDIMAQIKANKFKQKGMTPKGIDVDSDINGNGNNGNGNNGNGNGNINNNGNDKGKVKANDDTDLDMDEDTDSKVMEKVRNQNAIQNRTSPEAIETDNEEIDTEE